MAVFDDFSLNSQEAPTLPKRTKLNSRGGSTCAQKEVEESTTSEMLRRKTPKNSNIVEKATANTSKKSASKTTRVQATNVLELQASILKEQQQTLAVQRNFYEMGFTMMEKFRLFLRTKRTDLLVVAV